MASNPIALQLYTLRDLSASDFTGAVKLAAKCGYQAVEFAGFGGLLAKDLKSLIDDCGLVAAGSHVSIEDLQKNFTQTADYHKEIGTRWLVVSSAPPEARETVQGWQHFSSAIEEAGRKCREVGLKLAYHNHAFEFDRINGNCGYDILMSSTQSENVAAELDTYWVKFAGFDPVNQIENLGDRCKLLHLKDMSKQTLEKDSEIGEGLLDWPSILKAAKVAHTEWLIVEQEHYTRSLEDSIKLSLENLKRLEIV